MMAVQLWCRFRIVGPDGMELVRRMLEGSGAPDVGIVDYLARCALMARRVGGAFELSDVSSELRGLLELTGLCVEMEGQTERGKESIRVEEVEEDRHPDDLAP
jgi:hypothetical protein